jgi:hypothetical protein
VATRKSNIAPKNTDHDAKRDKSPINTKHSSELKSAKTQLVLDGSLTEAQRKKLNKATPFVDLHLAGPILFTAPHEIKLCVPRNHFYVEEGTTAIAKKLAMFCDDHGVGGSYCTWDLQHTREKDPVNLDPNYLTEELFPVSPWNWAVKNHHHGSVVKGKIPFHVDLHGKKKREGEHGIDIGIQSRNPS